MRTNEEKLELLADVIEPLGAIIGDKAWALEWQAGNRVGAIQAAIRGHKQQIIEILARVEGVPVEQYQIDGLALFFKLAAMINRSGIEATGLFTSRAQNGDGESSGPATENTGDGAK